MSYGDLMQRGRHAVPIPWWDEVHHFVSLGRNSDYEFKIVFSDIGQSTAWSGAFTPIVELSLKRTDKTIDAIADLRGVREDHLQVELRDSVPSINYERTFETSCTGKAMHRSERSFGLLRCLIQLPPEAEQDKVEAILADGVLRLSPANYYHNSKQGSDSQEQRRLADSDGHPDERTLP